MRHLNARTFITLFVAVTALLWIGTVWLSGYKFGLTRESISKLPQVITADIAIWFVFTKWLWKLRWLQGCLVPYPYIEGTWEGTLKTTWANPETGNTPDPIPTKLIIKQTFGHLYCRVYTGESSSKSYIADFDLDAESSAKYLVYSYANKPRADVRHRSEVHNGTAHLEIRDSGKKLIGDYWTDRKTTGELELDFINRNINA